MAKLKIGYDELWVVVPNGDGLGTYAEIDLPEDKIQRFQAIEREFNEMCDELQNAYEVESMAGRLKKAGR